MEYCVKSICWVLWNTKEVTMKKLLSGSIILSTLILAGGDLSSVMETEPITQEETPWTFNLEPYLMVTNIDGDSKFGRLPVTDLNVDFGTILDNLDLAGMVHFEALHKSGYGIWLDYGFMDLSNDIAPVERITSLRVRQGVFEAFGMYRSELSSGYIDYIAGIRWWKNDFDVGYNFPTLGSNDTLRKDVSWVDGVVGARYTYIVDENWKLRVHGDIGAGGADFTASTTAGFVYRVNDLIDVDVKYKATWVDYEEGTKGERNYFLYDTVTHGLIVGVNFKF